ARPPPPPPPTPPAAATRCPYACPRPSVTPAGRFAQAGPFSPRPVRRAVHTPPHSVRSPRPRVSAAGEDLAVRDPERPGPPDGRAGKGPARSGRPRTSGGYRRRRGDPAR